MTAPLPPLPEPDGIGIEIDGGKWEQDWVSRQDAFNEDAMRDYAKLAVREALERAALYLLNDCHDDMLREEEAAGIRAMIEEYK